MDPPEIGERFWREVVVRLVQVGMIDRVDVPLLEMLATAYARWHQAREVVADKGHFAKGSTGQVVEAPWVKIERESMRTFERLAESFGIGPLSRTKLELARLHARTLQ